MKDATLCFIFKDGKVLLQKKAPGMFGEGRWNGPGGKLRFGETPEKGAVREVLEETGLQVGDLNGVGVINFKEEGGNWFSVHIFTTETFAGEPVNKGEGELQWFTENEIPYDKMWEVDTKWFPLLLQGKRFSGDVVYSKGFEKLVKHEIKEQA